MFTCEPLNNSHVDPSEPWNYAEDMTMAFAGFSLFTKYKV